MRWIEKYGSLRTWEQAGSVFRAPFPVPCCVCRKLTEFIDMDYEAAFCSEECVREFEREKPGGEANAQQT